MGRRPCRPAGRSWYAPEPDYHGPDRFSYTVEDGRGLTASAAVDVTILPVNDPPEAVGVIPDQSLEVGDPPVTIDLMPYFRDRDGDALSYAAVTSDPVVTVTLDGAGLTLGGVDRGTAAVTVTAHDSGGLTAVQTFAVMVSDRQVRGVLEDTLAAMGRGRLASARSTLGRRVETAGRERPRVMVAGYAVPLGLGEAAAAGRAAAERLFLGTGAGTSLSSGGSPGFRPMSALRRLRPMSALRRLRPMSALRRLRPMSTGVSSHGVPGGAPLDIGGPPLGFDSARVGSREPALSMFGSGGRTEFLLPLGGQEEGADGIIGGAGSWTVWGQGGRAVVRRRTFRGRELRG